MNELIKQLAHRAWVDNDQLDACGYTDLQKFAELIVQECARLVQGVPVDTMGYHTADQKIKEHFGVE